MGRASTVALLLLSLTSVLKPSNSEVFHGVVGFNLSIPFTTPLNTVDIVCTIEGIKVFEWENGTEANYFGAFSKRTKLTESRILIQNLQLNDSGIYDLTFISAEGRLEKKSFNLFVHEPLSKPKIYCTRNDSVVHLNCYFEVNNSSVTIKWKHQNNIVQQDDMFDLSLERKHLTILNPEKSGVFTCHVEQAGNQVKSDPINIQDCAKEGNARVHVILALIMTLLIIGIFSFAAYYLWQRYGNVKNEYEGPCKENPKVESSQEDKEETKPQQLDGEEAKPQQSDGEEAKSQHLGDEETKPQPSDEP